MHKIPRGRGRKLLEFQLEGERGKRQGRGGGASRGEDGGFRGYDRCVSEAEAISAERNMTNQRRKYTCSVRLLSYNLHVYALTRGSFCIQTTIIISSTNYNGLLV
jgi:hypothetical protein